VTQCLSLKGFKEIAKVYTKLISDKVYNPANGSLEETKGKVNWLIETDGIALS